MEAASHPYGSKTVVDREHRKIGTVIASELSASTREPTSLLVALDDVEDGPNASFWLPIGAVRSVRRDEVQLHDRIDQLLPRSVQEATASEIGREAAMEAETP